MKINNNIILLFIYFLITKYYSLELISDDLITQIQISKLENAQIKSQSKIFTNNIYENFKFFKIDFNSIAGITEDNLFSFIKISIKPKIENTYKTFFLFANKTLYDFHNTTEHFIDYNIQDKSPTVFLPKKFYFEKKYLYFFVHGDKDTEFEYTIETFVDEITISEEENKFNILFKPGDIDLFYKIKDNIPKGYLLISLLASGVIEDGNNLYLDVVCPGKNDTLGKYYPYFINGVGRLITDKEISSCKNNENNLIKIILYNNLKKTLDIEFNSIYLESKSKDEFITQKIYENTIYTTLLLDSNDINKQCFKFKQDLEDREIFYDYNFNIRTTSSDLTISYYSEDSKKKNKQIIFTGMVDINIQKNTNYYICLQNNKKYNAGIQFQITSKFEEDLSTFAKMPLMSLINGFPTYFKLGKIQSMIYKVDLRPFQHIDSNEGYREKNKIVKYHLIKLTRTEIKMHHLQCKKFSLEYNRHECKNLYNNGYKMNLDLYLNYYYLNSNSLYYNEYVYVECEDEEKECEFLLDINLLDDTDSYPTQLINKEDSLLEYYYKPISKNYVDKYKISLSNNLKKNTKLYIILYMFSGDADLSLYDYNDNLSNKDLQRIVQETEYTSIGKKKYLAYNIKSINSKLNYSLREIILKITGLSDGFYSLKYYTVNNGELNNNKYFSLPVGEINFDRISFNEGVKTYTLSSLLSMSPYSHYYDESTNEYYININSLNCLLEVEFMDKKTINKEMQLYFYQKDIKKNKLKIKLHELDSKNKNNNEFCIYYIMSNSVMYQKNTIIINEGVVHTMTLNNKLETITYRYPYAFDDNIVSISLYKFLKDDLDVQVDINGEYRTHTLTMKNIFYKKLVIYSNTLREICLKSDKIASRYKDYINLCPINIHVRLSNKIDNNKEKRTNKFQIEILSNGKTPTYIQNGELRFDSFIVNQYSTSGKPKNSYVYYYSDIGKDEYPSEIIINSKFGSCEATAKIIPKNNVDMFSNWDRRVKLPTYDDNIMDNYIKYDYELSKFIINKKDLEKCQEIGCEIYVGIYSRETSVYFQINDFLIMFNKNYKNEPINLLFNQNIDDSLTKYVNTKNYISHLEDENINKLVFTFNSDFCSLCIIIEDNSNTNINNYNKCDWKLDNIVNGYKNYMLNIKSTDNKLKGKDLTKVKFISRISSQIKNSNDNLFYSLKISKQVNNLPMIINVDSINNEIAQLDIETGLAYYAIRIQEYQIINEVDILVISEEKVINNNIKLYAKIINQDEYNKQGINIELINNYTNYDILGDNEVHNHMNVKIFHTHGKEEDKIIFLVVKCDQMDKVDALMNHYVKIMVAFYKPNTNNALKINNFKLYNIEHQSPKFFFPLRKNKYSIVDINCLKGEGEVTIDTLNDNVVNNGENALIDLTCGWDKEYKIVLDMNSIYYNYNFNAEEDKFAAIKIKNKNYSVSKGNTFLFYISYFNKYITNNIEIIDINKDNKIYYPIINNIKNHKSLSYYLNINDLDNNDLIIEIGFNDKYIKNEDYLDVLSALVNDEIIYENMINEQQIIFSPLYGKNYYNKKNKKIYILFEKDDLKKYKKYFGYSMISISNNYLNYDIEINENENDHYLYTQIKTYINDLSKLDDCFEISNKNSNNPESKENNNNNQSNKNINFKQNFTKKIFIAFIIIFLFIVAFLVFRCIRRKNIAKANDYFNQIAPILKKDNE